MGEVERDEHPYSHMQAENHYKIFGGKLALARFVIVDSLVFCSRHNLKQQSYL